MQFIYTFIPTHKALQSWAGHFTTLTLNFLNYKMDVRITLASSEVCCNNLGG